MSLFTPTKLAIATITSAGIIGGSIGIADYMQTTLPPFISIEAQLEGLDKKLLKGDKPELWNIKFNTYNKEIKAKYPTITLISQDGNGIKTWCTVNTSINFKNLDQEEYLVAKAICTVPTNKEKFLSDSKDLTKDGEWEAKLSSYRQHGTGENEIPNINKDSVTNANEIKKWCNSAIEKEFDTITNTNYKLALRWCTKKEG